MSIGDLIANGDLRGILIQNDTDEPLYWEPAAPELNNVIDLDEWLAQRQERSA